MRRLSLEVIFGTAGGLTALALEVAGILADP